MSASEQLAAGIHGAWLVCLERSGQLPFLEEPVAFWRAVERFLDSAAREETGTSSPTAGSGEGHSAAPIPATELAPTRPEAGR